MNEETTYRPGADGGSGQSAPEMLEREAMAAAPVETIGEQGLSDMQQLQAQGVVCPSCQTVNDIDATFCANCGKPLRQGICPNCGSEMDMDADFCEVCHHYVRNDVCPFCGASLNPDAVFCPECGNPRGGILCPTCHTLNDFAFCKQCGTPLTDEARALTETFKQQPEYEMMVQMAHELDELGMELPYSSERDVVRDNINNQLRERILTLLAKDKGVAKPVVPPVEKKRLSAEEVEQRREALGQQLTAILERIATPPMASPAKARNYAMAQKPMNVRLAWVCNYKQAMHSSPCGCAKPQLGGHWVILGGKKTKLSND